MQRESRMLLTNLAPMRRRIPSIVLLYEEALFKFELCKQYISGICFRPQTDIVRQTGIEWNFVPILTRTRPDQERLAAGGWRAARDGRPADASKRAARASAGERGRPSSSAGRCEQQAGGWAAAQAGTGERAQVAAHQRGRARVGSLRGRAGRARAAGAAWAGRFQTGDSIYQSYFDTVTIGYYSHI
ncbi:hypothetical protein M5K25_017291 [Dendrobium thyrsiflorum]|uniref:Uncharacterized protein n=1 Tax=Dendrobium thyrsiflorum TaxID=117978 RepID=A0ABD0ULT7_DENTH